MLQYFIINMFCFHKQSYVTIFYHKMCFGSKSRVILFYFIIKCILVPQVELCYNILS